MTFYPRRIFPRNSPWVHLKVDLTFSGSSELRRGHWKEIYTKEFLCLGNCMRISGCSCTHSKLVMSIQVARVAS